MNEEERKMLAFVTKMLCYLDARRGGFTYEERQSLENIADELGYYELEYDEFIN